MGKMFVEKPWFNPEAESEDNPSEKYRFIKFALDAARGGRHSDVGWVDNYLKMAQKNASMPLRDSNSDK